MGKGAAEHSEAEGLYEWSGSLRDQPNQVLYMDRIHNKENVHLAIELRKNMTKEEKHLWYDYLKPYRQSFGVAFTRQKVLDHYIVDFYCPRAKLVIELDGSQHYTKEAEIYDAERTRFLNSLGIKVLRYGNRDIHTKFQNVCDDIHYHVSARIKALQE